MLPYDYQNYATEIMQYSLAAEKHAREVFGEGTPDFSPVLRAARRFVTAGRIMQDQQQTTTIADDVVRMNDILIQTERDLLRLRDCPNAHGSATRSLRQLT